MLPKDFAKSVVHDSETTLAVAISPCCWMYPKYPFQIQVHIAETGDHTIVSKKGLSFADATEADVDALVATLTIVRCPRCQSPRRWRRRLPSGHVRQPATDESDHEVPAPQAG